MARHRDYRAEYQRRIVNAAKRGLSRSQARGHARVGEASIRSAVSQFDRDRFEVALRAYRESGNQAAAAKSVRVSPERLRRFLGENVEVERRGRTLKITDSRNREMTVATDGKSRRIRLRDFDQASLNGRHQAAIGKFISTNDRSFIEPFEGRSVIDAKGKLHLLETRPNALYRLAAVGADVFHEIYRLIPNGG